MKCKIELFRLFRIATREECELFMLIGLPGSGKTTWVEKHVAENPAKRYNVIGTSALIERMKVIGRTVFSSLRPFVDWRRRALD
jgi:replication-associated recombination protein RarA